MTIHDEVPYADPEPFSVLIDDCRCVEGECAAHGLTLHPARHPDGSPRPVPLLIGEAATHVVDGYPSYGS